ncbi:MAG TPA: HAMP domain-containing sensor histidine kinase [Actinomycetota bacterium]|nr:HAMP domain-containing sensor histidine kinase [Actinomycetota bacterium]
MPGPDPQTDALRRRLERERAARREAERIAERVTSDLYSSTQEVERVNEELRERNEELAGLNRSLRDFVAVTSHDLRTPITTILGLASLLRTRDDRSELERMLEMIEKHAHNAAAMLDGLLTLSRIEAGALDTRPEAVDVREALEEVADALGHGDPIAIRVEPEDISVLVDRMHLRRILENFVVNALKHGAPPVVVEARGRGDRVDIAVSDSGSGVPEVFVPRMFERFSRAESARGTPGSGLGLSIVRGLAAANGGEIRYEPNAPTGSRFVVSLPRAGT